MQDFGQKGYLQHYGVLGMRWGKRKTEAEYDSNGRDISANPYTRVGRGKLTDKEFDDKLALEDPKHYGKEAVAARKALEPSAMPHPDRRKAMKNQALFGTTDQEFSDAIDAQNNYDLAVLGLKKGWVKAPTKKLAELSDGEIEDLVSDPETKKKLEKQQSKDLIAGALIAGGVVAASQFGAILIEKYMTEKAMADNWKYIVGNMP